MSNVYKLVVGMGGRIMVVPMASFADSADARTYAYEKAYKLQCNMMLTFPDFPPKIIAPFGD